MSDIPEMPQRLTDLHIALPPGWSAVERVEDSVEVDGLTLHRIGLSSRSKAGEALGAAADWRERPTQRGEFELLERVSLLDASRDAAASFTARRRDGSPDGTLPGDVVFPSSDAPSVWSYARSSGVALHRTWEGACARAAEELFERDRVLRSWLGEVRPVRVPLDLSRDPFARTRAYDWLAVEFPRDATDLEPRVAGVFGFPRSGEAPLVFGYGARGSLEGAVDSATREALQLLAFLWGEPIAEEVPDPTPSAMFHLEAFQVRERHALLRRWLEGEHARFARSPRSPADAREVQAATRFADLTPAWLLGKFHVAKARAAGSAELAFGLSPRLAHLPPELRIHPIP
jgi:ribosomal protein S12 methylthiotransferase accessory factor YcaO